MCWAARRTDSTASKRETRLEVGISKGGEPGQGTSVNPPGGLPRANGTEPVHLLAPDEGRVHRPFHFRGRLFHRHRTLYLRPLGGLFVVSPVALRHALRRHLRSPIAPRGGRDRIPGTHLGRARGNFGYSDIRKYALATVDAARPAAAFEWRGGGRARIRANLHPDDLLSAQVAGFPGWKATVHGERVAASADGIGFIVIQPRCCCIAKMETRFIRSSPWEPRSRTWSGPKNWCRIYLRSLAGRQSAWRPGIRHRVHRILAERFYHHPTVGRLLRPGPVHAGAQRSPIQSEYRGQPGYHRRGHQLVAGARRRGHGSQRPREHG